MADTKISGLTAAAALAGSELVPIVQGGANLSATIAKIISLAGAILVLPSGDATGATDSAAVQAAVNTQNSAGAGIVQLVGGHYYFGTPVVPKSGVRIEGISANLNYTTNNAPIPDSSSVLTNGGTYIDCKGGAGFQWAKSALGTPASAAAFTAAGTSNFAIRNLAFTNYSRAIDGGNTNNPAAWYAEFDNLYMSAGTDWGFWLTNFQHCKFSRIYAFGNATGQQFYGNDVPAAYLQPGNSVWQDTYSVSASNLQRCTVFYCTQGQQNQGMLSRIQCNNFGSNVVTQAATMANASTTVTVTDGTKFALQMPVTVSATANGFTANKIYFVVSVSGNNLTLALTVGGAAISATGATAVNVITQGFACLEMVALSGASFTAHTLHNVDCEGGGTAAIVWQNCAGNFMQVSQQPGTSQSTQGFCGRNVQQSDLFFGNGSNTDLDNNSPSSGVRYYGQRKPGSVGYMGAGFWYDTASTNGVMALGCSFDTTSLAGLTLIGGSKIMPGNLGISQKFVASGSATPTLADGNMSTMYTNTVSGTTVTLPTVSATNVGVWQTIINTTAAAQTIATNGTQTFNNVTGRTSITLNPNASMRICTSSFVGGTYGYVIEGASSAIVSGVVSAPT